MRDLQQDLRKRKDNLIREAHNAILADGPVPSAILIELEGIEKIESTLPNKTRARSRLVDLIVFGTSAFAIAILFSVRLPQAAVDLELRATALEFAVEPASSTNLIPGEAGQTLALKRAMVTGIEDALPISVSNGGYLELRATAIDDSDITQRRIDPSVRLFAIALPPDSSNAISMNIAYSGNTRGVSIGIQSAKPTEAALGRVIFAPSTPGKGPLQSAVEQISIAGKQLEFTLFPSDETRDLAIFRNTRLAHISFGKSGTSEILGGELRIRGRSDDSPIILRPSDLLVIRSEKPIILRELTLSGGQLKAILSASEAQVIGLGDVDMRDLRPTLLQWLLYRWPDEVYVILTAIIAIWLSIRRWWGASE
jgi:hypothetical protein